MQQQPRRRTEALSRLQVHRRPPSAP